MLQGYVAGSGPIVATGPIHVFSQVTVAADRYATERSILKKRKHSVPLLGAIPLWVGDFKRADPSICRHIEGKACTVFDLDSYVS